MEFLALANRGQFLVGRKDLILVPRITSFAYKVDSEGNIKWLDDLGHRCF